jgi:hypothetical protein
MEVKEGFVNSGKKVSVFGRKGINKVHQYLISARCKIPTVSVLLPLPGIE